MFEVSHSKCRIRRVLLFQLYSLKVYKLRQSKCCLLFSEIKTVHVIIPMFFFYDNQERSDNLQKQLESLSFLNKRKAPKLKSSDVLANSENINSETTSESGLQQPLGNTPLYTAFVSLVITRENPKLLEHTGGIQPSFFVVVVVVVVVVVSLVQDKFRITNIL